MAFSMTSSGNKQFADFAGSYLPAAHSELADQTATTAAVNTAVVGLQWARVKVYVKTFGTFAAADTYRFTLQVGTGAAITGPENIAQVNGVLETGDTHLIFELKGSSIVGFQSWKIIVTIASSHSLTFDVLFDGA